MWGNQEQQALPPILYMDANGDVKIHMGSANRVMISFEFKRDAAADFTVAQFAICNPEVAGFEFITFPNWTFPPFHSTFLCMYIVHTMCTVWCIYIPWSEIKLLFINAIYNSLEKIK